MPTPPSAIRRSATRSGSPYEDSFGFSRGVRVGNVVHIAGTGPVWPDGDCDPDPAVQAHRCWQIAANALHDLGADLRHVVRTRMYVTDTAVTDAVGRVHGEVFDAIRPAATMVVVAGLVDPRWHVEVEVEALVDDERPDPAPNEPGSAAEPPRPTSTGGHSSSGMR